MTRRTCIAKKRETRRPRWEGAPPFSLQSTPQLLKPHQPASSVAAVAGLRAASAPCETHDVSAPQSASHFSPPRPRVFAPPQNAKNPSLVNYTRRSWVRVRDGVLQRERARHVCACERARQQNPPTTVVHQCLPLPPWAASSPTEQPTSVCVVSKLRVPVCVCEVRDVASPSANIGCGLCSSSL